MLTSKVNFLCLHQWSWWTPKHFFIYLLFNQEQFNKLVMQNVMLSKNKQKIIL